MDLIRKKFWNKNKKLHNKIDTKWQKKKKISEVRKFWIKCYFTIFERFYNYSLELRYWIEYYFSIFIIIFYVSFRVSMEKKKKTKNDPVSLKTWIYFNLILRFKRKSNLSFEFINIFSVRLRWMVKFSRLFCVVPYSITVNLTTPRFGCRTDTRISPANIFCILNNN